MPSNPPLPLLKDAPDLRGKHVLLRLDLNLPIEGGVVRDDFRMVRSLKTLEYLREHGARTLIVSHIESKESKTLRPVFNFISSKIPVQFAENLEEAESKISRAKEGTFVLLENIRRWPEEKSNDETFAQKLASLAEIYVNEAFSASHRAHASIVGVPRFLPHYAGFLFEEEVENLSRAFSPEHPALLILGGAKFETKMPLLTKFSRIMDTVFICGALANDFYKARGYEVGTSLVSAQVPSAALRANRKLQIPMKVVVQTAEGSAEKAADTVSPDERIVDAGESALADLRALIEKAAFVLWNGPLGEYESGFVGGTEAVAQAIAESDAESIIGGGDSLAVVSKLGLLERFSFVSTGGGAMLEFLAHETLPGIEALQQKFIR